MLPARLVLIVVAVLLAPGCLLQGGGEDVLRIGSTTSTDDSGLLDALIPAFEADTGIRTRVIVAGTGEILEKARRGDLDVLLTHSPARERAFVEEGSGLYRAPVMYNRFLLVGPVTDPARVADAPKATEAFRRIAESASLFASRGDRSGTHDKELDVWRVAGADPATLDRAWYKETGSGQAATLTFADERGAYVLTDEATFAQLKAAGKLAHLAPLLHDEAMLRNQYAVVPVNASRIPIHQADGAERFALWLRGEAGQRAIAAFRIGETPVFVPNANAPEA